MIDPGRAALRNSGPKTRITVVLAAYDEAENIGPLTLRLIAALEGMADTEWRLVYVIEGRDGTLEKAQEFARVRPEIEILYAEEPRGLGEAFRRGFAAVPPDTDLIVTLDADLNHQPEEIPRLVGALTGSGADIVVGSRNVTGSRVEGTPGWKRALSGAGNQWMRWTMGLPVLDQTSGFRVYRYAALRRIAFNRSGFAFLPEILMRARELGLRMVEEPIQFIYRKSGESKMMILPTVASYVRLIAGRNDWFWKAATLLILLAGVALRVAVAFPVHKYAMADPDGVLAGVCATQVMHGSRPVFFPGGYRLGSQSCYVTAGFFSLVGVSRSGLALTGLLFGLLFLVFMFLYLSTGFGADGARAGLLLAAFAPVQLLLNTYVPWAYGEILMYCASTLWLASRLDRKDAHAGWKFAFGLSTGLALWCSIQSLMVTIPAVIWLLLRRRFRSMAGLGLAVLGAAVGCSPLWLFMMRHGPSQFLWSFSAHSAGSMFQTLSNLDFLATYVLPLLLFGPASLTFSWTPVAAVEAALMGTGVVCASILAARATASRNTRTREWAQFVLAASVMVASVLLYGMSGAGSLRGWAVRYILPLYLALPAMAAWLASGRNALRTAVVTAGVLFIAAVNVSQYPIGSDPVRESLERATAADRTTISWLERNGVRAVLGNYFAVYNFNFDARGKLTAVPLAQGADYFGVEYPIGIHTLRWAILDSDARHLERWKERLRMGGNISRIADGCYALTPVVTVDGAQFVAAARAAEPPPL